MRRGMGHRRLLRLLLGQEVGGEAPGSASAVDNTRRESRRSCGIRVGCGRIRAIRHHKKRWGDAGEVLGRDSTGCAARSRWPGAAARTRRTKPPDRAAPAALRADAEREGGAAPGGPANSSARAAAPRCSCCRGSRRSTSGGGRRGAAACSADQHVATRAAGMSGYAAPAAPCRRDISGDDDAASRRPLDEQLRDELGAARAGRGGRCAGARGTGRAASQGRGRRRRRRRPSSSCGRPFEKKRRHVQDPTARGWCPTASPRRRSPSAGGSPAAPVRHAEPSKPPRSAQGRASTANLCFFPQPVSTPTPPPETPARRRRRRGGPWILDRPKSRISTPDGGAVLNSSRIFCDPRHLRSRSEDDRSTRCRRDVKCRREVDRQTWPIPLV